MLISMPMVHSVEEQKVFALTMKTDMTAKAPQYFVKIVIQNAEEESVQLLVNLLSLEWAIARRREVDIWHCLETLSGTEEAESKPFLLGM